MKFSLLNSGDVDNLGNEGDWLSFERVVAAGKLVDASGTVQLVQANREGARAGRGAGGRKAFVTDRTVLILLLLLALENRAMHMTKVAYMVTNRLRPNSLRYLDLNMGVASEDQIYHRLARAFQRVVDVIDPFPGQRRRRLTMPEFELRVSKRDPIEVERLNVVLHDFVNSFVLSSVRLLEQRWADAIDGNYAVDATFVRSGSKRGTDHKGGNFVNSQPDGGRYFRAGDHSGTEEGKAPRRHVKAANVWGFDLTVITMVGNCPGETSPFPLVIVGVGWDGSSVAPGPNAVRGFRAVVEGGLPVKYALADRAYYSNAAVENFHIDMARFGFKPVTDYKRDQLGIRDQYLGAIQVEGWWYCPCMPKGLIAASEDYRDNLIDEDEYFRKIAARLKYAAVRKARPDSEGMERWAHPTGIGHRCDPSRKDADRFCSQKSISIPLKAGLKHKQELQYQSLEWRNVYAMRNTVESQNALLKRSSTHALGDQERRRLAGRSAQFILAGLVIVAANIEKIRNFRKAEESSLDAKARAAAKKARRPRRPFAFSTMNDDERAAIEELEQRRQ